MQDLFIQGTQSLPTISFLSSGELSITGRALPEDAAKFFKPLYHWVADLDAEVVNLMVSLDYFNTSVSKHLLDFFRIIDKNPAIKIKKMKWLYEDGDEEMLESGEIYRDLLPGFEFSFQKYTGSFP